MLNSDRMRAAWALVAAVLLVSGCGAPAPTPTPEYAIDADWTVHTVEEEGFSLALPPGWQVFDLSSDSLESMLESVVDENPELGQMIGPQVRGLAAAGIKFYALDLSPEATAGGFPMSVNIVKQAMGMEVAPDFMADIAAGQLESLESVKGDVTTREIDLPAGEAAQILYEMNMALPTDGRLDLAMVQYLLVRGEDVYVLSMGSSADDAERNLSFFDQIARSFRFID